MFEILDVQGLLIASPVVFVAYLVRGITGFGSGLIAIPVLSLFFPLSVTVPLVVALDYLASAGHGLGNRHAIAWSELRRLVVPGIAGVALGIYALSSVDGALLARLMGGFVVLYAVYSLWSPRIDAVAAWWAVPAGLGGGAVGTLFGTGGPFYVTYLKARQLDKHAFRATFASVFMIDGAARLVGYAGTGLIGPQLVGLIALGLPIMVVALYFGGRIHTSVSADTFKRAVSLLLLVSGSALLLK